MVAKLTLETARVVLKKKRPYLHLISYLPPKEGKCEVVDTEFNETYFGMFHLLCNGKAVSPSRKKLIVEQAKEKRKETFLEKHGVENASQIDWVKEKKIESTLKSTGYTNPMKSPEIRKKAREKTEELYGGKDWWHSEEIQNKIKETNRRKFGADWFMSSEEGQKSSLRGRIKSGSVKLIKNQLISSMAKKLNITSCHLRNLAKDHGLDFIETYTRKSNNANTPIEAAIANFLNNKNINYDQNQYLNNLKSNKLRYDFYLKEFNLAIECDGLYWHSDGCKDPKPNNYHLKKKNIYNENNIKSLFFREDEIVKKSKIVESIISHHLRLSERVGARKCTIEKISASEARIFFDENHLMGSGSGKSFALKYNNEIISAIRIIQKNGNIEISRFCNKLNTSVSGGLSRLVKEVIKETNPNKIISFVDLRYGDGKSLEKLNFKRKGMHLSFKWTDGKSTFSRQQFLGNSGYEHKLYKIWDCGQARYELDLTT